MRLLLTRPAEESERSRALFAAAGHSTLAEPLLRLETLPARLELAGVQALAVTSRQGLRALAALTPRRDLPLYAVGPASAELARAAGFRQVVAASGDAASLAALLARRLDPAAGPLLHAAGETLAADLGDLLAGSGLQVIRTTLYRACPAESLTRTAQKALLDGALDGVSFFSPRTAAVFAKLAVREGVAEACGGLVAACLSPAVAERAAVLAWREILVAAEPSLASLLEALAAYERRTGEERGG